MAFTDVKRLKTDVHFILKKLEPHSPLWTKLLRKYIIHMERKQRKMVAIRIKKYPWRNSKGLNDGRAGEL